MNERITKIEKQCWSCRLDSVLVDGQLHFDVQKFAQLIVEECARLCTNKYDAKTILDKFTS